MSTRLPPPATQSPWRPNPPIAPGAQPVYYQYQHTTNGMALAAIIATACTMFTGVGWVLGLIFGHISLHQLKHQPEPKQRGRGLALASVIIGWVGVAICVLVVALIVIAIGAAASGATSGAA